MPSAIFSSSMRTLRNISAVAAVFLAVVGMRAEGSGTAAKPAKPDVSAASVDLQKLIRDFNAQRDSLLADREALLNELKNATGEQKKAILDRMETMQKDRLEAQRALGKQIRDEMRKLRQSSTTPGRR